MGVRQVLEMIMKPNHDPKVRPPHSPAHQMKRGLRDSLTRVDTDGSALQAVELANQALRCIDSKQEQASVNFTPIFKALLADTPPQQAVVTWTTWCVLYHHQHRRFPL